MKEQQPKQWWISKYHSSSVPGCTGHTAVNYKPQDPDQWIEVQEVPKPKKRKLYAYLKKSSDRDIHEASLVFSIHDCIDYYKRLPSHDMDVDE